MRTIRYYIAMGIQGCEYEDTFEVEDDATDQQIEDAARDAAFDHIDWGFEEVKPDEPPRRRRNR